MTLGLQTIVNSEYWRYYIVQRDSGETSGTVIIPRPAIADRFEILGILGDGAAGIVYRVKDKNRDNQVVALKILSNSGAFDEHTIARFKNEIATCRKIQSPHLIRAFELVQFEDTIGYTMEFVPGSDLAKLCQQKRLIPAEASCIMLQILAGLEAMHAMGVMHRDIKLENVLVTADAQVKLLDLGLVKKVGPDKLTKTGILLGTAQYFPPEYVHKSEYTARSDLYTAGLVFLEMLAGQRWMNSLAGNQALDQLLKSKFKIPEEYWSGVSRPYRLFIEKATAYQPEQRFGSAHEMAIALQEIMQSQSNADKNDQLDTGIMIYQTTSLGGLRSTYSRQQKKLRRLRVIKIAICVVIGIGLAGLARYIGQADRAQLKLNYQTTK